MKKTYQGWTEEEIQSHRFREKERSNLRRLNMTAEERAEEAAKRKARKKIYLKTNNGKASLQKYSRKRRKTDKYKENMRRYREKWAGKLKSLCLEYKGSDTCSRCKQSFSPELLDFHHRDEKTKNFNISSKRGKILTDEIKHEIDKCDLVCCMCHRSIHAGLIK